MIEGKPIQVPVLNPRKTVRLLVVADEVDHENTDYYVHLKECVELSRHIYDMSYNFVGSGRDAIKAICSWEPSVILVDAHLGDDNGFDLVKHCLKEHLPVIVTSEHRSLCIEETLKNLGAHAYVPKSENPDDFEMLLHKIADLASEISLKH